MGKQERRGYIEAIRARYRCAGKAGKSAILNEFCAVCGYHRKYAFRLLGSRHKRGERAAGKPGPASRYDTPELVEAFASSGWHPISCAANASKRRCRYGFPTMPDQFGA